MEKWNLSSYKPHIGHEWTWTCVISDLIISFEEVWSVRKLLRCYTKDNTQKEKDKPMIRGGRKEGLPYAADKQANKAQLSGCTIIFECNFPNERDG